MTYAALHIHTELSVLDGRAHITDLVKRAREMELAALSITDHGSLSGLYLMHSECKKYGVKPILGIEAYEAPLSRTHKAPVFWGTPDQRGMDVSGAGKFTHLTVFAKDGEGLRSLYRVFAESYTSGFYGKPRVDTELLRELGSGLIGTSGCLGGAVQTRIRLGQEDAARDKLAEYREIFGADNFYVEVMRHDAVPEEPEVEAVLIRLAAELRLPVVATLDSHYLHEGDANSHDDMLCLSMNQRKNSESRMRFSGNGYHLQSPEEFQARFSDLPEAIENTLRLADQIGSYDEMFEYEMRLPDVREMAFQGRTLRDVVTGGLRRTTAKVSGTLPRAVQGHPGHHPEGGLPHGGSERAEGVSEGDPRIEYELSVIESRGFDKYLLVVADIVEESRRRGVRFGPARGSAAGSAVVYQLGITEIDPREHGLIFERFINPERPGFPDVDLDCSDRDLVIQVARELYGDDYVAQIGTRMTVGAKKALRAAANISGEPFTEGSRLIQLLPKALFGRQPDLSMMSGDGGRPDLVEVAKGLEGYVYAEGIHPAGLLISGVPLRDILPVKRPVRADESITVTSYTMDEVEKLGLLKTDYLGLDTMGVIDGCVRLLSRTSGPDLSGESNRYNQSDAFQLPREFTDPGTYELLTAGETTGVFQLESSGMRRLLKQVRPQSLLDISAVLALFRPGPMGVNAHEEFAHRKSGRRPVEYPHPEFAGVLAEILEPTYGLIVFQEQLLQILREVGGYTYGTAVLIFKAMTKKDREKLEAARPEFFDRLTARGYSPDAITSLWDTLVPFADYSFNKCTVGDTVITKSSRGRYDKSGTMTVKELHDVWHGPNTPLKWKYRSSGGLKIMARDPSDGRIRPDKVTDVSYQGRRPVMTITLSSGHHITSTPDHPHLTSTGWRRVDLIRPGDLVATMGDTEPSRQSSQSSGNPAGIHNGLRALRRSIREIGECEDCGRSEGRLEIAHLDSDRTHNTRENLRLLCNPCHKLLDYSNGTRKPRHSRGRPIVWSRVVSVESEGEQDVYDISMEGDDHSWVGNGIVTHNTHSTGYGIISYWTAYLKRHHTAEFFTSLLTHGDEERLHEYINEAIRWGVKILGPDINTSDLGWTLTDEGVRFGLGSIKGISVPTSRALAKIRPFTSVQDYLRRAPKALLNLKTFRSLVQVGAFDSVHGDREGLLKDTEILVAQAVEWRKDTSRMWSTFIIRKGTKSVQKRRADEEELLGLGLSHGRVKIRFKRFLDESELRWITGVLSSNPGSAPVSISVSPLTSLEDVTGISPSALPILRSMSILEVEEEK